MTNKEKVEARTSERYPYTYAYDCLRHDPEISRSDISKILETVAWAIGMDKKALCVKVAEYYFDHNKEITDRTVALILKRIQAKTNMGYDRD